MATSIILTNNKFKENISGVVLIKWYLSPIDRVMGVHKIKKGWETALEEHPSAYHINDSVSSIKKYTVNKIKKIKGELNASSESSFFVLFKKKFRDLFSVVFASANSSFSLSAP